MTGCTVMIETLARLGFAGSDSREALAPPLIDSLGSPPHRLPPSLGSSFPPWQVSIIEMSEESRVVIKRAPPDQALVNFLKRRSANARARSHGNYLPALDLSLELLKRVIVVRLPRSDVSNNNKYECATPSGVE